MQVSYRDNTSKTIGWDANKLTADPAQGTVLTVTGHSGKTVTISYGGKTAKTDALTVGKAEQAALSITGKPTTVYNGDTFTLTTTGGSGTGTVTWEIISGPATVDANGKVTVTDIGEIQIKAVKAADTEYAQSETTIALTAVKKPSSGGGSSSGGGGGSSSSGGGSGKTDTTTTTKPDGTKVQTETKKDGTKSQTETKKDGTKIQTETKKDGSVTKTTTNPNGSSVTENKAADGSTGTVKTDKHGQTAAKTALSNKAVEDAKKNGEAVKAPVEVKATRNSNTAPTVKIELPRNSGDTKVEIPVSNVKPGTVAVLVHPDGTEEIVKDSIPTENGVQLTVNGGATVKIVDNSKDFIDTRNHWAKDAIDFVSARGLVSGMSGTIYAPDASTTRAQLWTILARQNDADLTGGATWFENAQNWAKEKGISDGTNPNGTINRAQMVTMLWRAMGQSAAGSAANFTDVPADAYYAQAVSWAVENGITAGVGNGRFDPTGTCTRGQIATFLWRAMARVNQATARSSIRWHHSTTGKGQRGGRSTTPASALFPLRHRKLCTPFTRRPFRPSPPAVLPPVAEDFPQAASAASAAVHPLTVTIPAAPERWRPPPSPTAPRWRPLPPRTAALPRPQPIPTAAPSPRTRPLTAPPAR